MTSLHQLTKKYKEEGFISPIQILSKKEAEFHRKEIEIVEKKNWVCS